MCADKREQVTEIFRRYDKNGDGGISVEELTEVMKALGRFTPQDVKKIFGVMDTNRDGCVQYEEFVNWVFGSGSRGSAKARNTILNSNDPFQICFYNFCGKDQVELDGKSFTKLCKDTKLIDKSFTTTDTDIIFAKCITKGARRMKLEQFEKAVGLIADKKRISEDQVRGAIAECAGPVMMATQTDNVRFHDDKSSYTGAHRDVGSPSSRPRTAATEVEAHAFGSGAEDLFQSFCGGARDLDGKGWAKLCKDAGLTGPRFSAADADVIFTTVVAKVAGRGAGRMTYPMFEEALTRVALKKGVEIGEIEDAIAGCSGPTKNATQADAVRFHDDKSSYTGMHSRGSVDERRMSAESTGGSRGVGSPSGSPSRRRGSASEPLPSYDFSSQVDSVFSEFCGGGRDLDGKGFAKLCKDAGLLSRQFTATDADLIFTKVMKGKGRRMALPEFYDALLHIAAKSGADPSDVERSVVGCSGPTRNATQADNVRFHDDKTTYTGMHGK